MTISSEEVTEFIQHRLNYFPELEAVAERLWAEHGLAIHTLHQGLHGDPAGSLLGGSRGPTPPSR